ncbi:hypothetical protein [Acidovorax sp.]|uniref:hypothetical protein n=1 Tax=Acidovorax sp. TaxID=1872122 RepID=UPI0025BB7D51|nr:hypothetical protein [Acidovorax sp.]MCI5068415.1 hypothetical protein [Acidovorax sp.]
MAYSYPVKWITNTMRGAPQISGTAGTFIGALDAFLLTGWGTATATSVSISGGVGTAIFPEGTYFEEHAVVLFAGATTPAALNGEARVLSRTNNSITFETNAPDGVATTGTAITVKYAPVGSWAKPFQGANLAAYKSSDVQSSGFTLRVDDTGTMTARLVGYESMTDINTGSGAFPTAAVIPGGGTFHKSNVASAAAVRYLLVADSRAMLWAVEPGTASNSAYRSSNVRGFGEGLALSPSGDPWSTFLSCPVGVNTFNNGALSGGPESSSGGFTVCARGFSGLGTAVYLSASPFTGASAGVSGADVLLGSAPSPVDGKVRLSRLYLRTTVNQDGPRALVPGVAYVPHSGMLSLCSPGDVLPGSGDWIGRRLMAVGISSVLAAAPTGIAFIDISGPWR